jgi:hypothetical protein
VTSQSGGPGEESTDAYRDAWSSMVLLVEKGQMSWSGRESNRVFLNLGAAGFADVSGMTGAAFLEDGRACARLDWDDDGREDLILRNRNAPKLRLLLNRWPRPGNWLQLDLVSAGPQREAIGATVILEAGGVRNRATVRAGEGFLAASSKRLHFGLGAAAQADRAVVRWPDGKEESFRGLPANGRYRLVQGSGAAAPIVKEPVAGLLTSEPVIAEPAEDHAATHVPLLSRLPLAALPLPGWDAPGRKVADLAGSPVLINLFSTTCAACVNEFGMLRDRNALMRRTGLKVVPMLVEEGADPELARRMLAEFGLDQHGGVATAEMQDALAFVLADVLFNSEEVPLPCSFLLDRKGQLCVIYVDEIRARDLIADIDLIQALPADDLLNPRALGGRLLLAQVRNFDKLSKQFRRLGLEELALSAELKKAEVLKTFGSGAAEAPK